MGSVKERILRKIRAKGTGWVFSVSEFLDYGAYGSIAVALKELVDRGRIRRLARGLYDNPQMHPKLGMLLPTPEKIALALSGREKTRLQPSGAYAANLLGLSQQVPAKIIFLTDGPARTVRVGKQVITLKHTTPKNMSTAGRVSGLVIQALRHLKKEHVNESTIRHLQKILSNQQQSVLMKDIHTAPAWIGDIFRKINAGDAENGHSRPDAR
jgi:spermidine/putrescine-binding protein